MNINTLLLIRLAVFQIRVRSTEIEYPAYYLELGKKILSGEPLEALLGDKNPEARRRGGGYLDPLIKADTEAEEGNTSE